MEWKYTRCLNERLKTDIFSRWNSNAIAISSMRSMELQLLGNSMYGYFSSTSWRNFGAIWHSSVRPDEGLDVHRSDSGIACTQIDGESGNTSKYLPKWDPSCHLPFFDRNLSKYFCRRERERGNRRKHFCAIFSTAHPPTVERTSATHTYVFLFAFSTFN